jgi:hypothetical protein
MLSGQEWMSVLNLATVWNFKSVKETAVGELDVYTQHDPILKLIVAKRFDIPRWFVPAIHGVARREAPLDDNDFERLKELGPPEAICKFMLKIAQVRESFYPNALKHLKGRAVHDFTRTIKEVFDCEYEEDGPDTDVESPVYLVPKPSSWDFS